MPRTFLPNLLLLTLLGGCGRQPTGPGTQLSDLFRTNHPAEEKTGEDGWRIAVEPRRFSFPEDHAAHEDFRIEWWYYTGNLEDESGRRFGYQLTFFRTGLHQEPTNPSKWAVRDLYTAHFAISDIDNQKHYCFQRNNRAGVGQAGALPNRYKVWNGDWRAWLQGSEHRLQANHSDVSIDMTLVPTKLPTLHGEDGLSQKGSSRGNASYYYSFTRLKTEGKIGIGSQSYRVVGHSWMDHEFSTSFLEPGQLGWDWLAIQLDDGVDLMLYRIRRNDHTTDPFSSGSVVGPDGDFNCLAVTDFLMTPRGYWQSSSTGADYPLNWRIQIPSLGYDLAVRPAFEQQEMTTDDTTGISYWEGAIEVSGTCSATTVVGRGYMELTGYVGQGLGSLFSE